MTLKYLKSVSRIIRVLVDGKPVILIEQGELQTETCLRSGIQAFELQMKLRAMASSASRMSSGLSSSKTVS